MERKGKKKAPSVKFDDRTWSPESHIKTLLDAANKRIKRSSCVCNYHMQGAFCQPDY